MKDTVETEVYIQLLPEFFTIAGETRVRRIRLGRTTAKRPSRPMSGSVTVKLTMRAPVAAFLPLAPAAVVEILMDEADLTYTPVEVEVAR